MDAFVEKIKPEYSRVAVFGQGFVGLPLSLSFAMRGCHVTGVDVIESLVSDINNGITHHTEKYKGKAIQEILKEQLQSGRYRATSSMEEGMRECSNIIVTVGIPIVNGKESYRDLDSCISTIGQNLKKNDLVVIRSTVIPGTTEERILPILENKSGLKAGVDFYIGYSSERIAEGNAFEEFAHMPTICAGINEESAFRTRELLSIVCKEEVHIASNIKVVETAKVFENVQRDVNIAMVQEFARFAEGMDIDIFEIIKLANTHKRVKLLTPGPGVGGYCIPNAYYYLKPKAQETGVPLELLELSRKKNESLPKVMVGMLEDELVRNGGKLEGSKIAVLGIAMKDYSNDDRISPPIHIIKRLQELGARVSAYDPVVPSQYDFKVPTLEVALDRADGIMILAKQEEFDTITPKYLMEHINKNAVVLDTKNLLTRFKKVLTDNNIVYKSI
jgi:UDP-N-acetyl-D-mannosaminuronic acid dehydrogenase